MAIEGLDLETLLQPIRPEAPAGQDVRADFSPSSVYFRLRDARAEARAAERAADTDPNSEGGGGEAWRNVRSLALKLLEEQAKDLEAAAWLTEALVRSHGLAGLAFGATLVTRLAELYWDNLYPLPDEDGMETRVSPVTGLNGEGGDGTLAQPLYKLRLFNDANGTPVMLFQYRQSADLEGIADAKRKEARIAAGVLPFDKMQAQARAAPPAAFVALRKNLREAQAAWASMGETLDRLAAAAAPPTRAVREILDSVADIVRNYAPPEAAEAAETEDANPHPEPQAAAAETSGGAKPRKLATREDALAQLAEISAFFRRTEPQSPLAYTIEDAIRRGRLTWPELLAELVPDAALRNSVLASLGIKVNDPA